MVREKVLESIKKKKHAKGTFLLKYNKFISLDIENDGNKFYSLALKVKEYELDMNSNVWLLARQIVS